MTTQKEQESEEFRDEAPFASELSAVQGQKSLAELLNEIERRAADRTKCSIDNCPYCKITKRDVPVLVKALRRALQHFESFHSRADDTLRTIAAIHSTLERACGFCPDNGGKVMTASGNQNPSPFLPQQEERWTVVQSQEWLNRSDIMEGSNVIAKALWPNVAHRIVTAHCCPTNITTQAVLRNTLLPCPFCQIEVVGKFHELIEHPDVDGKPCPLNGGVFFGFARWNQRVAPSVVAGVEKKQDLGETEPSPVLTQVLQNALKECPWPANVWLSTLKEVGDAMRALHVTEAAITSISGTLMRHGWQCAEKKVQEILSSQGVGEWGLRQKILPFQNRRS